jgi:hypothetical protein
MLEQMTFLMRVNRIKHILAIISIATFTIFVGCNSPINSSSDLRFPEEDEVSFSEHVRPFMQVTCATASCHDDFTQAGGRRMTEHFTYFTASNIGLVVRENPDASLLIQILEGKNYHLYNYGRELPTENQQQGMRRWVENGAPNN